MWDWFVCGSEVSRYLERIAEAIERGWLQVPSPDSVARHARALASKVREFEEIYSDCGDGHILGYFVIVHDGLRVEALVARGESEPRIEWVNIEWWLADFKGDIVAQEGWI